MAEMRVGAEVGLKNVNRGGLERFKRPVDNEGLPGKPVNNRHFDQMARESSSLRVNQTKDAFKVTGNTINFQA